jgi:hypothetical protein
MTNELNLTQQFIADFLRLERELERCRGQTLSSEEQQELVQLRTNVADLKAEKTRLEQELNDSRRELREVQRRLSAADADFREANSRLAKKAETIEELHAERTRLAADLEALRRQRASSGGSERPPVHKPPNGDSPGDDREVGEVLRRCPHCGLHALLDVRGDDVTADCPNCHKPIPIRP